MRQVRYHERGGPEILRVDEVEAPEPGPGELLVETALIGTGLAVVRQVHGDRAGTLPGAPGGEVVGRVIGHGPGVTGWDIGQRVMGVVFGPAYAEQVVLVAALAVPVPDDVDDATAVGLCRSGQVALGVVDAARLHDGDRVLVTAAASGTGHLVSQIAALHGASTVTAAVSSLAKTMDHADATSSVTYEQLDQIEVDAVLDGVGGDVGAACLTRLAPGGRLVEYSAAGFAVDTNDLRAKGQSVIGFAMTNLVRDTSTYHQRAQQLLRWAATRRLVVAVHPESYSLDDADRAHHLILTRANRGKVILRL